MLVRRIRDCGIPLRAALFRRGVVSYPRVSRFSVALGLAFLGIATPAKAEGGGSPVAEPSTMVPEPPDHVATRPGAIEDDLARLGSDRPPLAVRRIVKGFDFDEQRFGNYSEIPSGWTRHVGMGFPQFLEGKFDSQVGHMASPSLRFDLDGGSLGFHYTGLDIAVRPNSDYLAVVWVKTEGLIAARAFATACFLDRKGNEIPGTSRRTELVGGKGGATGWQPLALQMRCDHPDARYLGLSLWLAQDRVWNAGPKGIRSIDREDIKATAWFDDIVVYRMPRASLATGQPGGLYGQRDPLELLVELSDPDGLHLKGRIVVRDADGRTVCERTVAAQTGLTGRVVSVMLPELPVGRYEVEFLVTTEGATLLRQSVSFLRVEELVGVAATAANGFGVVLTSTDSAVLAGQRQLLSGLSPQWVKVPLWYAQHALLGRASGGEAIDACLQAVREVQADPVGVLSDDPDFSGSEPDSKLMSMLDLLKEPPSAWKHLIANVWTRYSGLVQVWQIGGDGQPAAVLDDSMYGLVPRIRKEMSDLMGDPTLATLASVRLPAGPDDPSDYKSVQLPSSVSPRDIADHLHAHLGRDSSRLWVTVTPPASEVYPRVPRLADLGRRLIETYFAGVGGVFVEAPWTVRSGSWGERIDPREDYIIARTVANVLGGAKPVSRTTLDGSVECRVFDHGGTAVLCVWDEQATPEGAAHRLELGGNVQQLDLWGRRTLLPTIGRRQVARIGSTPTFLLNCPTWLVEFQRQFVVRPTVLEANFEKLEMEIEFHNTFHEAVSGLARLMLPGEWDVRPDRLPFSLRPGETFRQRIALRFPPNAQAQVMPLLGDFALDADRRYEFTTPAWFEFGIEGIEMNACAYRSSEQVTVRLSMTNRTEQTLHFEAYLVAPDRQRMERQFSNFQPGQSLTRNFVIPNATDLSGRNVRVGLKEIQGSRFWNRIVAVP